MAPYGTIPAVRDWRLSWTGGTAAACVAVALWCSFGVLTLTDGTSAASRVGVLPPWWVLGALLAGALAAAAALRPSADVVRPLFATALVIVPWLPVPMPAAGLVWAGPIGTLVWVAAVAASVAAARAHRPDATWRVRLTDRRAPWIAAALAFVIYTAAAARIEPVIPGGDEPHYLIITQSLLADGDLRIENNHTQGDYLAYAGGTLRPDFLRRGLDREIYSIHLPGVSVLVAPAFAAGGYPLARLWLGAVSAAASAVAWRVACVAAGSASAAWFAWAATALTTPFLFLAFTVYPDGPGSACVIVSLAALLALGRRKDDAGPGAAASDRSWRWWLLASLAPAALPWLHPRFSVLAGALGLVFALRALRAARPGAALAAFAAVPAASAAGWFGYYFFIYGSPNPSVAYGHYTQMSVTNLWRGVPGLLFDQQFGLLAAAPVFAVVVAGLVAWFRRQPRLAAEWCVIVVPYGLVTAAYHMWWGGHSSPARFLGPVMLACAAPLAVAWAASRHPATRLLQGGLLAASLLGAATLTWAEQGRLIFNVRDGLALWAVWATRIVDLARGLPSWFRLDPSVALASAAAWVGLVIAAWLVWRVVAARHVPGRGAAALGLIVLAALALSTAMSATWRLGHATGLAPGNGQLALLHQVATMPAAPAVTYRPFAFDTAAVVSSHLRIDGAAFPGRPAGALLWVPRVPAGRYRIWFETRKPGAAVDVAFVIGRGDTPADVWRLDQPLAGSTSRDVVLPRLARSIAIRGDEASQTAIGAVTIEPLEVSGKDAQAGAPIMAARRYGATLVMGLGETAYLEPPGIWTVGQGTADLLVTGAAGSSSQRLVVRAGGSATGVVLECGPWRQTFALAAGATREVEFPLPADPATPLRVTADGGFRPALVEPGSTDMRLLGVWLEFPR